MTKSKAFIMYDLFTRMITIAFLLVTCVSIKFGWSCPYAYFKPRLKDVIVSGVVFINYLVCHAITYWSFEKITTEQSNTLTHE